MLSESIRTRREALGLGQKELAEKAGVSLRTIGNAEAGKFIRIDSLRAIAKALKCSDIELYAAGWPE